MSYLLGREDLQMGHRVPKTCMHHSLFHDNSLPILYFLPDIFQEHISILLEDEEHLYTKHNLFCYGYKGLNPKIRSN